jgi:murein DD-endopeptidase MepM/ murein hydrolase activator NlpD
VQPEGKVQLSASFLEQVVPRLSPGGAGGDAAFQEVNTRVRAENEKKIRELVAGTASEPLFAGSLHQLANSKVTSRFGEKRIYVVDGREVSRAVHYGYDLASLSGAPVTASAAGRVLYAGDLGIYGNCIVLDHGLGLVSLYGHLSRIDVEANARVEADQRLGLTGATGLAGGDHLHFATLVGNTYVDPIEWWDAKWVTDHVAPNLNPPTALDAAPARRCAEAACAVPRAPPRFCRGGARA